MMRVTTGRVVNGKIEVSDEELAEGMVVTILAPEDQGTFILGPEAEAASWRQSRRQTAAR
jgi:hypothetical protein